VAHVFFIFLLLMRFTQAAAAVSAERRAALRGSIRARARPAGVVRRGASRSPRPLNGRAAAAAAAAQ